MTEITKNLWLGNSKDATDADLKKAKINAIFNVANDLQGRRGWTDGITYSQCGLVDGPGNSPAAYHAAILQLAALIDNGKSVLVHGHMGYSRSAFIVICHMHIHHGRLGFDHWRNFIAGKHHLPDGMPHPAHRSAFDRLNWRLMAAVLG